MEKDTAIQVLKQAILLERRGHSFYSTVAKQAEKPAVKQFFEMMAEEEMRHIQVLNDQFKTVHESGRFSAPDAGARESEGFAAAVITKDLAASLTAASFETAAIAAAMTLEKNAIRLYADRRDATSDVDEKALYQWLVGWEKTHLDFLADVEREVTESIWHDNSFWPF